MKKVQHQTEPNRRKNMTQLSFEETWGVPGEVDKTNEAAVDHTDIWFNDKIFL